MMWAWPADIASSPLRGVDTANTTVATGSRHLDSAVLCLP